jgi:hypothetical protein
MIIWYTFFTNTPNNNSLSITSLFFCTVVSALYPNSNRTMRLREWRVYRIPSSLFSVTNEDISKLKFVAQYNLERSPPKDGTLARV